MQKKFREFVEDQNDRAPFDHMAFAVQPPGGDLSDRRMRIQSLMGEWLEEDLGSSPADVDVVRLRDLLSERVLGLLLREGAGGRHRSMLDLVTTGRVTEAQIDQLFRGYDVDLTQPDGLAYVDGVLREAANFFDAYVVHGQGAQAKVPPPLKNIEDNPDRSFVYRVFKTAAGVDGRHTDIPTACALLRIAHVIDLAKTHPRIQAINQIHPSIQARLDRYLTQNPDGSFHFKTRSADPGIVLPGFILRAKHPFSIYAKLLHRPETDVESIRDLIGCLFKTNTPQDTLRLIYALFFDVDDAVFPPFLLDPGNSDQFLFDPQSLTRALADPEAARALVERMAQPVSPRDMGHAALGLYVPQGIASDNPHTAGAFRMLKTIQALRASGIGSGLRSRKEVVFPRVRALSVPIEFQFADLQTLYSNAANAPHEGYKDRQRRGVYRRLRNRNLLTEFTGQSLELPEQ